ncbi:putative complex I intermediate-associated protein 84, mitochondrial [Halenospora varia]|nr:putative complex I intermediate-associated protein 84, mitochondrial [Halenospora varia]
MHLVFRRILSNEGLTFCCPTQRALRIRQQHVQYVISRRPQHRSMFGFSAKPERKPKSPDIAPGYEKMCDLGNMQRIGARPPSPEELHIALRSFLLYKKKRMESINELQASHVLRTIKHLRDVKTNADQYLLETPTIKYCMSALKNQPKGNNENNRAVIKAIYEIFSDRNQIFSDHNQIDRVTAYDLIHLFSMTGSTALAKELALHFFDCVPGSTTLAWKAWKRILLGFSAEKNELQVVAAANDAESLGFSFGEDFHSIMTSFFATQNNVSETKKWYARKIIGGRPTKRALQSILWFSTQNNELDWCKQCFRQVIDEGPSKSQWDIVLQWAGGALGKGVEDVERMINVMKQRQDATGSSIHPDIYTINGLVGMAMSRGDPYLAERYVALGRKHGILPDAKTYLLQMSYRVDAGDLSGAQACYTALQAEEVAEDKDLPVINKYIRALCGKPNNYDHIVAILSDLEGRKAHLETDTATAVAMMFMKRDEIQDVFDILQTNVYHYTVEERARIGNAFISFCLDRTVNNARAWESYQIIRQLFDETGTEDRTKLMNEFFERGRSDMACYVFGHMRQHVLSTRRPTLETYVQCFEGIARCEDSESLEMVHNMFKMDSNMEPNTKLYNSLMLAYSSVGDGSRALDFWEDITNSEEGPSYRSLEIVFRACEVKPFGGQQAKEIWDKMRRMEIEITREVFIGFEEPRDLIDKAEKELGIKPDMMTIGVFYNAIPSQGRKDMVEEWAKGNFPEQWAELEKIGQTEHEEGHRLFNIKRDFKA